MNIKKKHLLALYHFYLEHGFDYSTEKIANEIGITKKTLFNRYRNKQNMECVVQRFWREQFDEKLKKNHELYDNAIEELLLFVMEFKKSYEKERFFFQRELENDSFLNNLEKTGFIAFLKELLIRGIQQEYIKKNTDLNLYARFFIHSILYYCTEDSSKQIIYYIFLPILTEKGNEFFVHLKIWKMG